MTSPVAFMLTCAPDHPEVRDLLSSLNQVLPNADRDLLEQVRRVHACVMLVISRRLEGRLLDALDDDREPLPAATLFREIARLRKEAIALLESLLLDAAAPGRSCAGDTAEVLDPASEMISPGARCIPENQEIMRPAERRLTDASSDIAQHPDNETGMPGQVLVWRHRQGNFPFLMPGSCHHRPENPAVPVTSLLNPSMDLLSRVPGTRPSLDPGFRTGTRARLGNKPREGPMRDR